MHHHLSPRRTHWLIVLAGIVAMVVAVVAGFTGSGLRPASAATDRAAARPIMGWSSWSFYRGPGNQAQILAQAAAMHANLQSHGYVYVNLDAGWSDHVDNYGRDVWDRSLFPMGIPALAAKLHGMGLKFGLYLNPGIRQEVVSANRPILGTHFHAKDIADTKHIGNTTGCCYWRIDFSKPGSHEYIQSYVDLFASWGVDYVKMDFVGPGGGNAPADNRPDMQAWNQAIVHNGRPIVLELSNSLSFANASTWKKYANGWRIDGDIECYSCEPAGSSYPLTSWKKVLRRFADLPEWTPYAGPGGWNDLDSLELGNGTNDGLTVDQRQSAMTLWSIGCAPLLLGADLTHLDRTDRALMTNDEVIAVNQAGVSVSLLSGTPTGTTQVWSAKERDGSYAVALFNLGTTGTRTVSVTWRQLGLSRHATVRELWTHTNVGTFATGYTATVAPGASRLIQVTPPDRYRFASVNATLSPSHWSPASSPRSGYACRPRLGHGFVSGEVRTYGLKPQPPRESRVRCDTVVVAYDEDLANRIREIVQDEPGLTEKRMFGGLAFLINGNMAVSASGQGGLLLRVDPTDTPTLVQRPEAGRFEMRGREMDGWLRIDPTGLATKRQLKSWISRGISYARSLPAK